MVKAGDFDRLLLRPRSTVLQLAGTDVMLVRAGQFAQGLAVMIWAVSAAGIAWTPAKAIAIIAGILGGACLFSGLFVLQATLSFWTVDSLEIVNTVTYGGRETAEFPLTIYAPWFRRFFTWIVPLAAINYFPVVYALGRTDPLGTPRIFQCLSPLIGILFLIMATRVWEFGVRHYRSTGS